jgi:hypothetical protein
MKLMPEEPLKNVDTTPVKRARRPYKRRTPNSNNNNNNEDGAGDAQNKPNSKPAAPARGRRKRSDDELPISDEKNRQTAPKRQRKKRAVVVDTCTETIERVVSAMDTLTTNGAAAAIDVCISADYTSYRADNPLGQSADLRSSSCQVSHFFFQLLTFAVF